MTAADERIEQGVAHGRALRANGATPAEIVQALAPIADAVAGLREQVQS